MSFCATRSFANDGERKKEREKESEKSRSTQDKRLVLPLLYVVPVTPFCAYAKLPAAVAPVTAATVVPTISFALNPSLDKAGTNTTAPPKPVIAETIPAKEPEAAENAAREDGVDNDSTATALAIFAVACFAAIVVLFARVVRSSFHTYYAWYLRAEVSFRSLMRYTSDSLVAQRNFPSLYIKQQKFLLFSWLEKKNATGITTTKRKVFLFLLLLCLLLRVFVCLSEPSEKRRLQRREFTHQIILTLRKHPKRAAEREVFLTQKK